MPLYPSEMSCPPAAGHFELDLLATCFADLNLVGDSVETLFEYSAEFDSLIYVVAVMNEQKWLVQRVLGWYYPNVRASAGLALMKGLVYQNTSFVENGTYLENEAALKALAVGHGSVLDQDIDMVQIGCHVVWRGHSEEKDQL